MWKRNIPSKALIQLFYSIPRSTSVSWGILFIRAVLKKASFAALCFRFLNSMCKFLYSALNDHVHQDAGVFQIVDVATSCHAQCHPQRSKWWPRGTEQEEMRYFRQLQARLSSVTSDSNSGTFESIGHLISKKCPFVLSLSWYLELDRLWKSLCCPVF